MAPTPATNRQVPDNAILDHFNKQAYLGNRYNYLQRVTVSGTSEVAKILLANPSVASSAFPSTQAALFVDLRALTTETNSANSVVKVYLNPTISAQGSAQTPVNLRVANANASIANLRSGPTASANGTLIEALATTDIACVERNSLIILDPGKSILITLQGADTSVVDLQLSWYEI